MRTIHNGALHFGQSGRPLVLSSDEWPLSVIFRLPRLGESALSLRHPTHLTDRNQTGLR